MLISIGSLSPLNRNIGGVEKVEGGRNVEEGNGRREGRLRLECNINKQIKKYLKNLYCIDIYTI